MKKYKIYTRADPAAPYSVLAEDFRYMERAGRPVVEFTKGSGAGATIMALFPMDNLDGIMRVMTEEELDI